jgi:hypothetical protein
MVRNLNSVLIVSIVYPQAFVGRDATLQLPEKYKENFDVSREGSSSGVYSLSPIIAVWEPEHT